MFRKRDFMSTNFAVVGGDLRIVKLVKMLAADFCDVFCKCGASR